MSNLVVSINPNIKYSNVCDQIKIDSTQNTSKVSKTNYSKDIFDKSNDYEIQYLGYTDIKKTQALSLPINTYNIFEMKNQTIATIVSKMRDTFDSYYLGNVTLDDIKNVFEESFEILKNYNITLNRTSGTNIEDNKQMLLDTYCIFRREGVVWAAQRASIAKGAEIAKKYGVTQSSDGTFSQLDWVYYDAEFHYMSEAARTALKEVIDNLAIKYNLGNIDSSQRDNDDSVGRMNGSYNENWAWHSASIINTSTMINPELVPPKGFTFFYKEQKYSAENLNNGSKYLVTATDGLRTLSRLISVPKGESFWKNKLYHDIKLIKTMDGKSRQIILENSSVNTLDITLLINQYLGGRGVAEAFDDFLNKYIFNPEVGVMIVGQRSWSKEIDVPYNLYSVAGNTIDYFNAGDVFQNENNGQSDLSQTHDFLRNFNVFTRTYGFINRIGY